MLPRLAVAIVLVLAVASPGGAGFDWCEDDPIVTVDGRQFQMITGFPASQLGSLHGPVRYSIELPRNVQTVTIEYPPSRVPSHATYQRTLPAYSGGGDMDIKVTVRVNASARFDWVTRVFGAAIEREFAEGGRSNESQRFGVELRRHR